MKKILTIFVIAMAFMLSSCGSNNKKELRIPPEVEKMYQEDKYFWTVEEANLYWTVPEKADLKRENADILILDLRLKSKPELAFDYKTARMLANKLQVYLVSKTGESTKLEIDYSYRNVLLDFFAGRTHSFELSAIYKKDVLELFDQAETFLIWI